MSDFCKAGNSNITNIPGGRPSKGVPPCCVKGKALDNTMKKCHYVYNKTEDAEHRFVTEETLKAFSR